MFIIWFCLLHTSKHQIGYSFFEHPLWAQGHAQDSAFVALDQDLHRSRSSSSSVVSVSNLTIPKVRTPVKLGSTSLSSSADPTDSGSDRRVSERSTHFCRVPTDNRRAPTLHCRVPTSGTDTTPRIITSSLAVSLSELSR